jgi:hypothetical protein
MEIGANRGCFRCAIAATGQFQGVFTTGGYIALRPCWLLDQLGLPVVLQ